MIWFYVAVTNPQSVMEFGCQYTLHLVKKKSYRNFYVNSLCSTYKSVGHWVTEQGDWGF